MNVLSLVERHYQPCEHLTVSLGETHTHTKHAQRTKYLTTCQPVTNDTHPIDQCQAEYT